MKRKPLDRRDVKTGTGSELQQYWPPCERDGLDDPRFVEALALGTKRSEWLGEVLLTSGGACFGFGPSEGAGGMRPRRGYIISLVLRCRQGHQLCLRDTRAGAGSTGVGALATPSASCTTGSFELSNPRRRTRIRKRGVDS